MSYFVCGAGGADWLPANAPNRWCCYGDVADGPRACTCWVAIYDLEQQPVDLAAIEPVTRTKRCVDCAFRPDSPERVLGDDPADLPHFWCHQGIRRPRAYRHPDGTVIEVADSPDYQPPIVNGVPYRASGQPAERCAGWSQAHRETP